MAIPVNKVTGIGPKTAEYLATKKIKTVEQLLKNNIDVLASAPGIGPVRAEAAIKEANKLLGSAPATGSAVNTKQKGKKEKGKARKDKKKDKKKNKKDKKGKKDKKKDKKNKQ